MGFYQEWIEPSICVYYPKYVRLENDRLGWLLWIFRIGVVAFIIFTFQDYRPWLEETVPLASSSMWINPMSKSGLAMERAELSSELCNSSTKGKFDYQYDADGSWTYFNHTCKVGTIAERWMKGGQGQLFVPTYTQDTWTQKKTVTPKAGVDCSSACSSLADCGDESVFAHNQRLQHAVNGDTCVCTCIQRQNYFWVAPEALEIEIEHHVSGILGASGDEEKTYTGHDINDNMLTVLRNSNGEDVRRFQPGDAFRLPLKELLALAGQDSLLDPATFTSKNHLQTPGVVEYPPLRLTGMTLSVKFNYYNPDSRESKRLDHDGPVCFVDVNSKEAWTSKPVLTEYGGSPKAMLQGEVTFRQQYHYGLQVHAENTGTFYHLNLLGIFFFLASAAVYLQLPMILMHILMWFFLGDLSTTMDGVLHETPNWSHRFSRYVCQAMAAKLVYRELVKDGSGLDAEIKELAQLCGDDHETEKEDIDAMKAVLQCSSVKNLNLADDVVDEKEFLLAFTMGATLKDRWRMFHPGNRRPFLQRLLDGNLHRRLDLVRAAKKQSAGRSATLKLQDEQPSEDNPTKETCDEQLRERDSAAHSSVQISEVAVSLQI